MEKQTAPGQAAGNCKNIDFVLDFDSPIEKGAQWKYSSANSSE